MSKQQPENLRDVLQLPPVEMAGGIGPMFYGIRCAFNGLEPSEFSFEGIVHSGLPYAMAIGGAALFAHGLYRAVHEL